MPEYFVAPNGWYRSKSKKKLKIEVLVTQEQLANMRLLIEKILDGSPDVMTVPEIRDVTGYSVVTICRWCRERLVYCFMIRTTYFVPKVSLIEFMMGAYYRRIIKKTTQHKEMLMILKET